MSQENVAVRENIQDPLDSRVVVSVSPHIRSEVTISAIMYSVLLALVPASLAGVYFFGFPALKIMLLGIIGAVAAEAIIQPLLGQKISVRDGSAAVTGLLLALTLPPTIPWYMVLVGSAIAIILGKSIYGGLGNNPFNPALIGRVVLLISWPVQLTRWQNPTYLFSKTIDAVTAATPLGILKSEGLAGIANVRLLDLLLGNRSGCIGEIAILAILLGFGFLLWKGYVTWHIPISCIATVFLVSGIFWLINPNQYANPAFHLLSGGLILGACFMATDMVTSPMTSKGMIIFGMGIGLITIIIRLFGGYPEGVSFAILLMNAGCPLIDRYTKPKAFGRVP